MNASLHQMRSHVDDLAVNFTRDITKLEESLTAKTMAAIDDKLSTAQREMKEMNDKIYGQLQQLLKGKSVHNSAPANDEATAEKPSEPPKTPAARSIAAPSTPTTTTMPKRARK